MAALPPARMATTFFQHFSCAVCGRDWPGQDPPVPSMYTEATIEAHLPPEPICDYCVQVHDPQLFAALLADRRRYWAN